MHGDAGRDGAARGENETPLLGFDGIIKSIIIVIIMMAGQDVVGNDMSLMPWMRWQQTLWHSAKRFTAARVVPQTSNFEVDSEIVAATDSSLHF